MIIRFIEKLEKLKWFLPLVAILFIFFLLRLPSLFEPYWYGDEGIYHVLGKGMKESRMLYGGVWDNKPPLLYIVYAIFNADQFWVRLSSLIIGALSVVFFFFLSLKLFSKASISLLTTFVYAVIFAIPLLEGNIANAENYMLLPIIMAMLFTFTFATEHKKTRLIIWAGILFSIAFLFKVVGIFDFATSFVFLVFVGLEQKEKIARIFKTSSLLTISFLAPIVLTFFWFFITNNFEPFFSAAFKQNIGYVGYGNTFFIAQGLLLLKLAALLLFLAVFYLVRKRFSLTTQFIFIWVLLSLFNAFFSQRPYTHYLLILLPSMTLLFGLIFYAKTSKIVFERRYLSPIAGLLFVFLVLFLERNFWIQRKVIPYYQNFISYIAGSISTDTYRGFFDQSTITDYELADFLNKNMKPNDKLFIWGNNAQLYILTNKLPPGRFTVMYHMINTKDTLEETRIDLSKNIPEFIVVTSQKDVFPFSLSSYGEGIRIKKATIYERINE